MKWTWEYGKKLSLEANFCKYDPNFGNQFFFFNAALSVTRYHGQPSSCTISEKINDPILRKLNDEWMDRAGRDDMSDFIGRCLTNVEQPKYNLLIIHLSK